MPINGFSIKHYHAHSYSIHGGYLDNRTDGAVRRRRHRAFLTMKQYLYSGSIPQFKKQVFEKKYGKPLTSFTDISFFQKVTGAGMFKYSSLFGDHKKLFKEKFGKQQFCYTTWYRSWNWVFDYKGCIILVACSVRGTSYTAYPSMGTAKKPEKVYKEFLNEIKELIEE